MTPMYEFRDVPGAGMATFATRDIERGTVLMREPPLMVAEEQRLLDEPFEFYSQFRKRSEQDQRRFNQLFAWEGSVETARGKIRKTTGKTRLSRKNERKARLVGIFLTNCFRVEPEPKYKTAVYNEQSRLNHMCCYNAINFPKSDAWQQMKAVRNIKAGEELTCTYLEVSHKYKDRQARARTYGFTCGCALCAMEKYINKNKDIKLDIFGRTLVQSNLKDMIEFFRNWFEYLQHRSFESRKDEARKLQYDLKESVPFSEIALEILERISAEKPTAHAAKNVEYWKHVMLDFENRYGNCSDWLRKVNATDPRIKTK